MYYISFKHLNRRKEDEPNYVRKFSKKNKSKLYDIENSNMTLTFFLIEPVESGTV